MVVVRKGIKKVKINSNNNKNEITEFSSPN
jgi:hypothetical protein